MTAAATAILTNWGRPENIPLLVESIRRQTVPIEIFLWDNSGSGKFRDLVDLEIVSSRNLKCLPRWSMAQFASAPYVFNIDDDLAIKDPCAIENCIKYVGDSDTAVGKEGVTLLPEMGYAGSIHIGCHSEAYSSVDILKGRFIFARKSTIVSAISGESASVSDPRVEDDVMISAGITGQKILPPFLVGAFSELPDRGIAEWRLPDHRQSRENAASKYFPYV